MTKKTEKIRYIFLASIGIIALQTTILAGTKNRWEYEGNASTSEKVFLNLDSIQIVKRSLDFKAPPSYFFDYQIGKDRLFALTPCNGLFQVASSDDGEFVNQPMMRPQSEATRMMIERVCSYHRKQALVFNPPSYVRMIPDGDILCSIKSRKIIKTYGLEDSWFYTDACGRIGVIHFSQVRF